jgi:hypothetical protein
MSYSIKDEPLLKRILWLDSLLGGVTAITGLLYFTMLTTVLGFTTSSIVTISTINLLYASLAFMVAVKQQTSIRLLRLLVLANWVWTAISVLMIFTHFNGATHLGGSLLVLQPIIVGGLAYLENNQIIATRTV